MKPQSLYDRDYNKLSPEEESLKWEWIESKTSLLKVKPMDYYPAAVRHNLSLFPNNHIELAAMKAEYNIGEQNEDFLKLISKEGCLEQEVLNFINHTPAYHIVGSILVDKFAFGHHELYLFKEMRLGEEYRTDYVLIGKGSGGYEFVLVEFEKPDGRITLKDGHWGETFRKGQYQTEDWKAWMDANYTTFRDSLRAVKGESDFPEELQKYDSTKFHYVVAAGRRSDFNDTTYREARSKSYSSNTVFIHHDNLYDNSVMLETKPTF